MSKVSLPEPMISAVVPHVQQDGRSDHGDDFADTLSSGKASINPLPASPKQDSPNPPIADPPLSLPRRAVISPIVVAPPQTSGPPAFSSGSPPDRMPGTPMSVLPISWTPLSDTAAPKSGGHAASSAAAPSLAESLGPRSSLSPLGCLEPLARNAAVAEFSALAPPVPASSNVDDGVRGAASEPMDVLQATLFADAPVWSRVYPQHWFANAYLSFVDAQKRGAEVSVRSMPVGSVGISERHAEVEILAPKVAEVGSDSAAGSVAAPVPPPGSESPAPADADESIESIPGALGSAVAADHVWAERLVRITRDGHGASTVWLRDYTLNEAAIDPLVQAMKRHAYREGVMIDRVMVNGHEVWRAALSQERN